MDWKIIKENYLNYVGAYKNLEEEFIWLNNEFYSNEIDIDEEWNNNYE